MRLKWLGSAVLVVVVAAVCSAQTALTNDAIIKMVKAGLGEDLVLTSIKAQPGTYTTGADDLIALKKAGVSDKIIAAMIARPGPAAPQRPQLRLQPPHPLQLPRPHSNLK